MNPRLILFPLAAAGIGFVAGRGSHPSSGKASPSPASGQSSASAPEGSLRASAGSAQNEHSREPRTASPQSPRINVPIGLITDVLKADLCRGNSEDLIRLLPQALTLLGVTDRQREEILDRFTKAHAEVLAAEQTRLKAEAKSPGRITIDTTPLQEPIARITQELQGCIAETLPPDTAAALTASISWQDYYMLSPEDKPPPQISFSVERKNGSLILTSEIPRMNLRGFLTPSSFPADATSIPAEKLLNDSSMTARWAPLLKGMTLTPADSEN